MHKNIDLYKPKTAVFKNLLTDNSRGFKNDSTNIWQQVIPALRIFHAFEK